MQAAYKTLPYGWQKGTTTRWAKQTSGVLIPRFPPPGLGLSPIYAEMRPDEKIVPGRKWTDLHRHDLERRVPGWERERYRNFTISEARLHIVRAHAGLTPAEMSNDEIRRLSLDELRAMNQGGRHRHPVGPTQYLFPPGFDANGLGLASRIDIHPDAVVLIDNAEYVFFGIEGCLKADSILTGIVDEGLPASVFSVPAVWLWLRANELPAFAYKRLSGKPVVIVPDADWATKWEVWEAAHACKERLEDLGVRCCIAAPPREGLPDIKGVDDYRAAGGKLLDLRVLERERTPHLALHLVYRDVPAMLEAAGLVDGGRANLRALDRAAEVHDRTGQLVHGGRIRRRLRRTAESTGLGRDYLRRGWNDLVEWGIYELEEGSMELVTNPWSGHEEWKLQPSLRPPPPMVPREKPERTVREWLDEQACVVYPGKSAP